MSRVMIFLMAMAALLSLSFSAGAQVVQTFDGSEVKASEKPQAIMIDAKAIKEIRDLEQEIPKFLAGRKVKDLSDKDKKKFAELVAKQKEWDSKIVQWVKYMEWKLESGVVSPKRMSSTQCVMKSGLYALVLEMPRLEKVSKTKKEWYMGLKNSLDGMGAAASKLYVMEQQEAVFENSKKYVDNLSKKRPAELSDADYAMALSSSKETMEKDAAAFSKAQSEAFQAPDDYDAELAKFKDLLKKKSKYSTEPRKPH